MNKRMFHVDGGSLMPNTHRRRDETVRQRRRCEHIHSQLSHDDCRRIGSTILETDQTDSLAA